MKKIFLFALFFTFNLIPAFCDDPWILPYDSLIYKEFEELYISSGKVPPLEEKPVTAEYLVERLNRFIEDEKNGKKRAKAGLIIKKLKLPFPGFAPILEQNFYAARNTDPEKKRLVESNDYSNLIDFLSMYEINKIPSILTLGFILYGHGFALQLQPELRASTISLLDQNSHTNLPVDIKYIDINFPYRGVFSYYKKPLEISAGRDKLHLGPGKWSTLTLSHNVPYFDHVKAKYSLGFVSFSAYLLQLNATITDAEHEYLIQMYEDPASYPNPETNTVANGKSYITRAKHYALARFSVMPVPWLMLNAAQTNLIGGRYPFLSDVNPLGIYHNIYAEGVYSVPITASGTVVPLPGMKFYIDFLFYDAALGDERDNTENPLACAYQGGFTMLSDPYFQSGPGRLRMDGEFSYVDPWVYGKYYNFRKFTSRIIYVVPFASRFWVDYPLGFYLGPDSVDLHLNLSYGIPGTWEAELHWNRNGIGSIDMYGWGDGNDYSHIGESDEYPLVLAPSGLVQWTDKIELSFYMMIMKNLKLSAWYNLTNIQNRFHEEGNNQLLHNIGICSEWKVY